MDPEINMTWDEVKESGDRLTSIAADAHKKTDTYFASQDVAAQGNRGFSSGPALCDYANALRVEMHGMIDDLGRNGNGIVEAAKAVGSVDNRNAEGFSREISALSGVLDTVVPHTPSSLRGPSAVS